MDSIDPEDGMLERVDQLEQETQIAGTSSKIVNHLLFYWDKILYCVQANYHDPKYLDTSL